MPSRAEVRAQLRVIHGGRLASAPDGHPLVDAIRNFLIAGKQAGQSQTTLRQYGYHLDRMRRWLRDRGVRDLESVDRSVLREWGAEIQERWKPATVRSAVKIVRLFLSWCYGEGLIEEDLSDALKIPKVPKRIQRTVTPKEVRRMLAVCDQQARDDRDLGIPPIIPIRNAAIISLLFDSMLRGSELLRLTVDDIDLDAGILKVVRKGGDEKIGYFGRTTAKRLRAWLEVRPALPGVKVLFTTLGGQQVGQPLTIHGLRTMLATLSKRAGIEHVSPHSFRRGGACAATALGAPTHVVAAMGGWESTSMVMLYTRALGAGDLVNRYSPVDHLAGDPEGHDPP